MIHRRLGPEQFRNIWRSGHSLWCVEGCQGGTCPKCSPEHLARVLGPASFGKFCKLMDHSGSATVLWTPPVFTSNVSVICVFMRGSRLHCIIHWQSVPQSAFPIRLHFMPGGVLGSLVSVHVFTVLVRSCPTIYAGWYSASLAPNDIWSVQMPFLLV